MMERDKMTDAEWKEINNRCEFVYNDFRVRDAIDAMLVQRPEAPAETSCDNSSGQPVIAVPSCVPAERMFTVDQFAAKEREIAALKAHVRRLSRPFSEADAFKSQLAEAQAERDALKAQVERLSRPFSEAEVIEKWPEASLAEAGLANAMTLARLGLRAWTKDSIALTVAIDAARAAEKGPSNG